MGALTAQVAAELGLQPESFGLFDDFGKVTDSLTLQRAVDMATLSPCTLQVKEAPEWQKIRQMETKLNMLVARCPVVDSALLNIEERSAKRFEKLAQAMQGVEQRA